MKVWNDSVCSKFPALEYRWLKVKCFLGLIYEIATVIFKLDVKVTILETVNLTGSHFKSITKYRLDFDNRECVRLLFSFGYFWCLNNVNVGVYLKDFVPGEGVQYNYRSCRNSSTTKRHHNNLARLVSLCRDNNTENEHNGNRNEACRVLPREGNAAWETLVRPFCSKTAERVLFHLRKRKCAKISSVCTLNAHKQ